MHFTRLSCSKKAFALSLAFFLLALGFSMPASAATTVTFGDNTGDDYPGTVEDAVIASDLAMRDFNYGAMTSLHVGTPNYSSSRRSFIRFKDIALSLGAGQVIASATMYLYCHAQNNTTARTVSAYRVLLNWGEGNSNGSTEVGAVCTNDAQYDGDASGIPWNALGCDAASNVTGEDSTADRRATPVAGASITGTGWFSWDLTTAVKKWYSGEWSEYGLILISSGEGTLNSLKQFAASENGSDGYRPYLEVTYYAEAGGTTLTVCGAGPPTCGYTTIQAALAAANAGDTVKVMDGGTYTSSTGNPITMKTGVDLVSNAAASGLTPTIFGQFVPAVAFEGPLTDCILDRFAITGGRLGGGGQINMEAALGSPVTEVTIQNCLIDGSTASNVGPAIRLTGPVAFTLRDCQLLNCMASCIVSPPGHDEVAYTGFPITIEGCEIQSLSAEGLGGAGIRIMGDGTGAVQLVIGGDGSKANHIHDCPLAGIRLDNFGTGSSVTIDNNVIEDNGSRDPNAGIDIESVASATITRNTIRNNGRSGISINANAVDQNITIGGSLALGNEIYSNDWAGISFGTHVGPVKGTFNIQGNNIYSNSRGGIYLYSQVNGELTVSQNDIHHNSRGGIAVRKNCEIEITKNNIRNNGRAGVHTGKGSNFAGTQGGAVMTIRQNKIHDQSSNQAGIDVRHASGVIENNLVYKNGRGGIRFGESISEIRNNTVVANGQSGQGGGIVYHDASAGLTGTPSGTASSTTVIRNNISTDHPDAGLRVGGAPDGDPCPDVLDYGDGGKYRDFNLIYANYPWNDVFNRDNPEDCGWFQDSGVGYTTDMSCTQQQYGGCGAHFASGGPSAFALDGPSDMMADPEFLNPGADNYQLGEGSPAEEAGDDDNDLGAYGGGYPIVDAEIPEF